jgi:hypothetical protein
MSIGVNEMNIKAKQDIKRILHILNHAIENKEKNPFPSLFSIHIKYTGLGSRIQLTHVGF